ncbi:hypothetical protein [Nitratifractor salsuginis]|uniref:Nitric oxide-responding transcriptional regulator Dnr (Crp/Fnr family) n=1 Tax=Nitratifractor salsuginis (strain DSM 16511 / JCM 12458 / E9I37-1) TaxID=749222 RepID=E6X012_NITSE|nr:hypothetical protein [Nitratifractor salsuginis]ADV46735.1 hypothetical protein Nitsa_1487 [Nitratifractor salsuginis DSM 16511]
MKKLLLICALLLGLLPNLLSASTRAEVNVLEATENIRYLSQHLTRNYLYLYANPKKVEIEEILRKDLDKLVENIRTISLTTNDEDTKNILEFLTYSKDQIEELLQKKPNKKDASLMLDYSETLLEGANSIAKAHAYKFSESEKMLMISKNMEFLAERSAKYYLALGIGLGTEINRRQMQEALGALEKDLKIIDQYSYPLELLKQREALGRFWEVSKSLYKRLDQLFVSNLLVLSTDQLETLSNHFVLYHRKNQ